MSLTRYDLTGDPATGEVDITPVPETQAGRYVAYEDYAALEAKCVELAAEKNKATSVEAFLAEVRAQGVDMAACALDDVNQFNYANMLDDLAQKIRKGVI